MSALVDASSPIRFTGTPVNGGTIVSASFTAPANSIIVVDLECDGSTPSNGTISNTVTSTPSLTWTKQVERLTNETTDGGASAFWWAEQVTSAARTVTVTHAHNVSAGAGVRVSAKVYVVTGADIGGTPVDTVGANNEGGTTTNNFTTTGITPGANGLHFGASCDFATGGAFDAPSDGSTQDTANYAGAISVCSGYKTCTSGVGSTMNLNAGGAGAVQQKWCQIIVREAAGGGGATNWGPWMVNGLNWNRLVQP